MKKPDLLILIAIWQLLNAAVTFLGLLTIAMLFAIPWTLLQWNGTWGHWNGVISNPEIVFFIVILGFVMLLLLAYFVISLAAGIGTIQGKNWARILGIVHAVISIVNFPVGTAIGVLIIVYLEKEEVKAYFEDNPTTQTPEEA